MTQIEQQDTEQAPTGSPWDTAHPSVAHFRSLFAFGHLPAGPLRSTSAQFATLADWAVANVPSNPELVAGLRKLLEAKDCLVRSHIIARDPGQDAPAEQADVNRAPVAEA